MNEINNIVKTLPKDQLVQYDQLNKIYRLTLFGIFHAKGSEPYKASFDYVAKELQKGIQTEGLKKVKFDNIPGLFPINPTHRKEIVSLLANPWKTGHTNFDEYFEINLPEDDYPTSIIIKYTDPVSFCRSLYVKDEDIGHENLYGVSPLPLSESLGTDTKGLQVEKEIIQLIKYETDDPFRKGHIDEINRAYTCRCYTSVFILCRKVIENMIIDILKKKFPPREKQNKELYFDINKRRFKDFGVILDNFYAKRNEFDLDKKIVERIVSLAKPFKKEANDKAHSWFHLVRKRKEIDDIDIQGIIDLIRKLEESLDNKKQG
jgi:hypothetical protein